MSVYCTLSLMGVCASGHRCGRSSQIQGKRGLGIGETSMKVRLALGVLSRVPPQGCGAEVLEGVAAGPGFSSCGRLATKGTRRDQGIPIWFSMGTTRLEARRSFSLMRCDRSRDLLRVM